MKGLAVCWCLLLLASTCQANAVTGFFDRMYNGIKGLFEEYEEAPYTVIRNAPGYEERSYPAKKWACTQESGLGVGDNMGPMFWRLFQYINGQNDRNATIPMTVPVSTEVTIASANDKQYIMCFYIDDAHQSAPPQPTNPTVFIQDRQPINLLTRTVGGYMNNEANWMSEAGQLAAVIQGNGETVSLVHMYWVGYDAPFKFWNRRNEVWFPKN